MSQPYFNVIRMHLLIFFFFCYALKLHSFFVYAVVYSVYFFPWSELNFSTNLGLRHGSEYIDGRHVADDTEESSVRPIAFSDDF